MDPEDALIERITENLHKNGFPEKKVAFPASKLHSIADEGGVELDMALSRLSMSQIYSKESGDKIFFASSPDLLEEVVTTATTQNESPLGDLPFNIDPAMFAGKSKDDIKGMADQLMGSMSDEEKNKMMQTFMNMDATERDQLMGKAKDMGIM